MDTCPNCRQPADLLFCHEYHGIEHCGCYYTDAGIFNISNHQCRDCPECNPLEERVSRSAVKVVTIGHVSNGKTSLGMAIVMLAREDLARLYESGSLVADEAPQYREFELRAPRDIAFAYQLPTDKPLHPYGPTRRGRKGKHQRW